MKIVVVEWIVDYWSRLARVAQMSTDRIRPPFLSPTMAKMRAVWSVLVGLAPSSALLLQPLVLHAEHSCCSRTPPGAVMESADSSLVSAAAVASALKAEEAQRARWEAEAQLPRAERRKRTSATRDLSQSFIAVGVEPSQAVKYAEALVDRGVRSLEGLDADMIAACGVLAVHREQIKAASLGVSARTARVAEPELVTALGAEVGAEGETGTGLDAGVVRVRVRVRVS